MLAKERQLRILNRLQLQPFIKISELCQELHASKSTIQRDLKILEEEGKIKRERGGVVQKKFAETMSDLTEAPVFEKVGENEEAKKKICQEAAKRIKDGDLIFIGSGTTPTYLIPYIQDKKIKIVTNSYFLLPGLKQCEAEVYLLGGRYSKKHEITMSPSTLEQLKEFRFDKVFIGANGLDLELGEVYTSEFECGALKQTVMKRSRQSYLLVDDSKFSITAICRFGYADQFDQIIVNDFPKNKKKYKNIVVVDSEE